MKKALYGYWNIFRKHGFKSTLWSFYSYYYTKYKLKKIKKPEELFVNTHGCQLKVIPNDKGISTELLVFGSHEPDTTKFVSELLKEGMTCIDIGANIGYYSTLYSKIVGLKGKVISIEPSPLNFKYLKENLLIQKLNNFELFNCACGARDSEIKFQLDLRGNKCMIVSDSEKLTDPNIINVPIRQLDNIIQELKLQKIDFIKIDVEGYEWEVILGSNNLIKKFHPTTQIEIHFKRLGNQTTREILEFFKNEGYEVIYYDTSSGESSFFRTKKTKKLSIDQLLKQSMNEYSKNSFKLILQYTQKTKFTKTSIV